MKSLEDAFAEIELSTLEHLGHRRIVISDVKAGRTKISIEHSEVHKTFFEITFPDIDEALTVDTIWERLSTYWNFHSCNLFEKIVYEFGDRDLKENMEDYKDDLKDFKSNILLDDFAKYSNRFVITTTLKTLPELVKALLKSSLSRNTSFYSRRLRTVASASHGWSQP